MKTNDVLYMEALIAIKALSEDKSVSDNETLCSLDSLKEYIEAIVSSLYK
jgi:hypothetical protein